MKWTGNTIPVAAQYATCGVPEFDDNIMSSALGAVPTRIQMSDDMGFSPKHSEEDRLLPVPIRKNLLPRILASKIMLPFNLTYGENFHSMMRMSYLPRDPNDKEVRTWRLNTIKRLRKLGEKKGISKMLASPDFDSELEQQIACESKSTRYHQPSAGSMYIFGVPSTGKTAMVEDVLNAYFYNRVIKHKTADGRTLTQIPVIYVHCPGRASTKQMITLILKQLQELTGEDFEALLKFEKDDTTEDRVTPELINLLLLYNVGCIIVDEVEMIRAGYSGGGKRLKNFWLMLMNESRIPMVLIGNPDAGEFFQEEFKLIMRLCAGGGMIFDRLPNIAGGEWRLLLELIWNTQFTKTKTELIPGLINEMYRYSQGLIKLTIRLYYWVQRLAITNGDNEIITPELIRAAFEQNAKAAEDIINGWDKGEVALAGDANIENILKLVPFTAEHLLSRNRPVIPDKAPALTPTSNDPKPNGQEPVPRSKKKRHVGANKPEISSGEKDPVRFLDFIDPEFKGAMTTHGLLKKYGRIRSTSEFKLDRAVS